MFWGVIWDKLLEYIFENFSKIARVIFRKNHSNQTCCYWLITLNQQRFCIETNSFNSRQLQISQRHLKNYFVNGAMLIPLKLVIR